MVLIPPPVPEGATFGAGEAMTGTQFRENVLAIHAKHTGAVTEYGAMTWFGHHCGRTRRAVYRWCASPMVDGEPLRILRLLEAMPAGTPWARNPELLEQPLPADFPHREALRRAGFRSQADVFHALDGDLLAISGIGHAALERIRGWWEKHDNEAA